jgi:hypothetical protein
MRLVYYQSITVTKVMLPMMVAAVACGPCQLALYGLSLKYGVVVETALAHVAANNQVVAADQDHTPAKLFA